MWCNHSFQHFVEMHAVFASQTHPRAPKNQPREPWKFKPRADRFEPACGNIDLIDRRAQPGRKHIFVPTAVIRPA